ncbi:MAG: DoxX family membrane protein [bacterium]
MKNTNSWVEKVYNFLFSDKRSAVLWLPIRLYIGWEWLIAGWDKLTSSAWTGAGAGSAVSGFLNGALDKTVGQHADVSLSYAWFINNIALPHAVFFSYLVSFGEFLIGIALILGIFTGVAAFFGAFMNFNYLFAGTVSSNPWLLLLQILLMMSRKIAGWIGIDYFLTKKPETEVVKPIAQ